MNETDCGQWTADSGQRVSVSLWVTKAEPQRRDHHTLREVRFFLMAETETETGTGSGKETETVARPDKPQQLCPLLFKFFA